MSRVQREWFDPLGWLGTARETRGGVVQTEFGPRVEVTRPDGSKHLAPLDPVRDRDLNPAQVQDNWLRRQAKANNDKLEARSDRATARELALDQRNHDEGVRRFDLQNQTQNAQFTETIKLQGQQTQNLLTTTLAQIQQQGEANKNQFNLGLATLQENSEARKDANYLAAAGLNLNAINQQGLLELKRTELASTAGLEQARLQQAGQQFQDELAYRRDQLAATRGAAKLNFISSAVQSLLA